MIRAIFGTEQKLESARTLDCGRELHPFVNVSVLHICSFTKMFSYGASRQETCSSYDYKTELHIPTLPLTVLASLGTIIIDLLNGTTQLGLRKSSLLNIDSRLHLRT